MGILRCQLEIISLLLGVDHRKIKCILISSDSYIGYCDTFALTILHGQAASFFHFYLWWRKKGLV